MLTDRDERALLAAAENRISEPLRIGAALAAVRRVLTRRPPVPVPVQERESVACHPTPTTPTTPIRPAQPLQPLQPIRPVRPGLPTHR
ncbi:hypothetical protein [Streptomyces sp. ISL-94]|uniref:hypothetical protein n=1 Tax=Streptomyces sp. ISL-94 TaxID=2819190 RepID=UPI001BE6310B|nr:hypothetical protein [Streptomyces sp. ISL-94]MBT2479536.1 hypothetical protein [Streptomyces sp. ISL-94]